jgi:hypothetical protein
MQAAVQLFKIQVSRLFRHTEPMRDEQLPNIVKSALPCFHSQRINHADSIHCFTRNLDKITAAAANHRQKYRAQIKFRRHWTNNSLFSRNSTPQLVTKATTTTVKSSKSSSEALKPAKSPHDGRFSNDHLGGAVTTDR